MRTSKTKLKEHLARIGVVGAVTAVTLAATATAGYAAVVPMVLSATQGPSGGGNTFTATTPATATADGDFKAGTVVNFQFLANQAATAPACNTTYLAPVALAASNATPPVPTAGVITVASPNTKVLSLNKLSVTVPSSLVLQSGQTTAKFSVCAYSGTVTGVSGSPLIATALYSIAAKGVVNSISPATGPAQGGTTITVNGSNFPTTAGSISGTLGGSPLTGVTPINASSFTAVTPAHVAGGPFSLIINTPGGTTTKTNVFTYTNGIVISPNFGSNTSLSGTDVDVTGVGFSNMTFTTTDGSATNAASAHVYLVDGEYDPTLSGGNKTNGQVDECLNVLVVSDVELICTLTLRSRQNAATGAYQTQAARTFTNGVSANAAPGLTTATDQFTQNDVGLSITVPSNTQIAANTVIQSVTDARTAVLSANALGDVAGVVTTVGPRTATIGITDQSTAITGGAGTFFTADVGRSITGTGIPLGATIASVTSPTAATLSVPATATNASASATVANPTPVPVGTYTLTVVNNGAIGAQLLDPYIKTIISSGSTFTVADY